MSKNVGDAIMIIESITLNYQKVEYNRYSTPKKVGLLKLDTNDAILAQINLSQKL